MAAPARWVFAGSMTFSPGGIQHMFDATAQPRGSFGPVAPQWLKDGEHGCRVDHGHRRVSDRSSILGQCHRPLRAMLGVAPFRTLGRHELVSTLAESWNDLFY